MQLFLALMNLEPTWNTYKSYEYISWQFTPYSIVTQKTGCSIVVQYPDCWHIFFTSTSTIVVTLVSKMESL